MKEIAKQIYDEIKKSKHVVFLTGAGVSTASGIPDYRSRNGLYNTQEGNIAPEQLLSSYYLYKHPKEFHEFNKKIFDFCKIAEPNAIHTTMAKLVENGDADIIITQNIDNLHFRAFSDKWKEEHQDRIDYVIEYHGNDFIWKCDECNNTIEITDYPESFECDDCGEKLLRPTVVLYDEMIDAVKSFQAMQLVGKADLIIVVGTSLTVYPFAELATPYFGQKLIIINQSKTSMDHMADLLFNVDATEVFKEINNLMEEEKNA